MEHIWSPRRTLGDSAEAAPRVIAALYTGKPDTAVLKEAIALLIRDPSFINRIWEQGDPAMRNQVMNSLFDELAKTAPETMLEVIDATSFTLSGLPDFGDMMYGVAYNTSSPLSYLEAMKRNKDKMGRQHFDHAIRGAARRPESARVLLTDAVMGMDYQERDLLNACSTVFHEDGSLPPGTFHLEAVKKFFAREAAAEGIGQWLDGNRELTPAELKELHKNGSKACFDSVWEQGKTIDARKLDLFAQAGLFDEQKNMLTLLVEGGRTKEAMRTLDALKDMPASKSGQSELLAAVAAAIYEFGGDVGEASRLMADISDDPTYWKSMEEVLKKWAIDDPVAGRAYLEQVTDPDLRRVIEETANKSLVSP